MTSSSKPNGATAISPGAKLGFTLMELILVMVIIAILAAAVIPSLSNFRIGRANANTATQIIALSQFARTQSISEGRVYRMTLDPDKGTYELEAEDDGGDFQPATGDYGQTYTIDKGVKMAVKLDQAANTKMNVSSTIQQDAVQSPLAVADPTVQTPNTLMVNHRDVKDGMYVDFEPSGRTDTVRITLTDRLGSAIFVGCTNPTELFHLLSANEMQ